VLRQRQHSVQKRQRRRINISERGDPQVVAVLAMAAINPDASTRQIQRDLDIPKSTAHRILVIHNFHPYHIALTQELTPDDFRRRLVFCNWTNNIATRSYILQVCIV